MTRWKTTLVLLLVVIGVGAYVSLYELKQPMPERREALARQVVDIEEEQVTRLDIQTPTVTASLERLPAGQAGGGEAWRLTSPVAARADAWFVRRILATLDPLEANRVLTGTVKPADCGLEPPRGTLKVTAGGTTTTLLFGDQTAVGKDVYLTLPGSPNVFIVDAMFFDHLNQSLDAYRARELLPFETWKATALALTSPKASFAITKSGEAWRLTDPIADEADSTEVVDFLNDLKALRIERFLADQPTTEQLGWLEPSYAKVTLTVEGTEAPLELTIGASTTDNEEQRVARRADEPALYAVAVTGVETLVKEPQDLRARTCLTFPLDRVTKVQVTWEGSSWTLEHFEGANADDWLRKLHGATSPRFVEDLPQDLSRYGLAPPKGTIQVWIADQPEPAQLLVGDMISDSAARYGRAVNRPSVVELPELINDLVTTKPDSFKPSQPAQAATGAAPPTP